MSVGVCVHCGQRLPPSLEVTGTKRRKMLEYLAKSPNGVTVWQILDAVYADDPNGGVTKHNIISVMAHAINKQIEPQGFKIRATGGPGSLYRLVALR